MSLHIEPLADVDAERERLYALAKDLGLAWAGFRRRCYSVPAPVFTDEEIAAEALRESTDEEDRELEIESETVALLQKLADLYEGAGRRGGDA